MAVVSFRFRNLFSIRDAVLELRTPVTLLVGPNGAGKSNVLRGIELLSRLVDNSFQETTMRAGGFSEHLFQVVPLAEFDPAEQGEGFSPECFSLGVVMEAGRAGRVGYEVQFLRGVSDGLLLRERLGSWGDTQFEDCSPGGFGDTPWCPVRKQSLLSDAVYDGADQGIRQSVRGVLVGCRVFHFDDSSSRSPVLQSCDVADSYQLHADGRNLAAVLWRMQQTDQERYQGILRSVRCVAPFIDDFVVAPVYEGSRHTVLRWKQRGVDGVFSAERLSSGTLRFICLVVLLQQTTSPQTIVLDEPELGLHPFAIYQLAEMLHGYCSGQRKAIVTTQSVTLANQFALEELALVTRDNGGTVITRPDMKDYEAWLDDYSVGQLWESNVLGISPRREAGTS